MASPTQLSWGTSFTPDSPRRGSPWEGAAFSQLPQLFQRLQDPTGRLVSSPGRTLPAPAAATPATHRDPQLRAPGIGHGRRGCCAVGAGTPPVPPRRTWPHAFLPAGLSLTLSVVHTPGERNVPQEGPLWMPF